MRWWKGALWFVAVAFVLAWSLGWLPIPRHRDVRESREAREKQLAEAEAKRVERKRAFEKSRTDATLEKLRVVGRSYRRHLDLMMMPPTEEDFRELTPYWRSTRDDRPFVILWGVDLTKLPGGGAGMLLAWEHSVDESFARCVLMADGTARIVSVEEFEKLPRAK